MCFLGRLRIPVIASYFSTWGVVYSFQTKSNAQGQSTITAWHAIRANKEDWVAKLEWAPGGVLGHTVIGL
ncbi:hypothetical protein BGW80DRAFT_1315717 [Lactifluus volemus]|nr:hypothetical protein BGW80DRAFT_1315717 [Lactifluus volemus]